MLPLQTTRGSTPAAVRDVASATACRRASTVTGRMGTILAQGTCAPPAGRDRRLSRACPVDLGRREQVAGGVLRKAEEEPIAELWATTRTPRSARRVPRSRP